MRVRNAVGHTSPRTGLGPPRNTGMPGHGLSLALIGNDAALNCFISDKRMLAQTETQETSCRAAVKTRISRQSVILLYLNPGWQTLHCP